MLLAQNRVRATNLSVVSKLNAYAILSRFLPLLSSSIKTALASIFVPPLRLLASNVRPLKTPRSTELDASSAFSRAASLLPSSQACLLCACACARACLAPRRTQPDRASRAWREREPLEDELWPWRARLAASASRCSSWRSAASARGSRTAAAISRPPCESHRESGSSGSSRSISELGAAKLVSRALHVPRACRLLPAAARSCS